MQISHNAVFSCILICRTDMQKLAEHPKTLRGQIVIDLSRLQAFRTHEITMLRWGHIDLDDGWILVFDSKKHIFVPLPLNCDLAKLFSEYEEQVNPSDEDWVIRPLPSANVRKSALCKPVTNWCIEQIVKFWAEQAKVSNSKRYNPTLLRAYFAAEWYSQKRNLKALQYIMRHNELSTTLHYVSRVVFWEDLEAEFNRIRRIPTKRSVNKSNVKRLEECASCPGRSVCKHIEEAVQSEWAEGCRFKARIIEEVLNMKIVEEH